MFIRGRGALLFSVLALIGLPGCLATQDWVGEQIKPISGKLSETDSRLTKVDGRFSEVDGRLGKMDARFGEVENRIGQVDARIGQVDAKADRALTGLANLRLERKFVLDLKEGAHFAFDSHSLSDSAKKELDSFFSDLKGDLKDKDQAIFLIAGHTDGVGREDYNYDLGQRRADNVARYLITQKKVDPLRVKTVSYGKSAPLADNKKADGRKMNRRIEILVYQEGITTEAQAAPAAADRPQTSRAEPAAADARVSSSR